MCNCLETDPATWVHCGSIRLVAFWYCGRHNLVAPCRACGGRGSKERLVEGVLGATVKGFPVRFSLWTSRGWRWKRWRYWRTIRYSKRREIRGDGGNVAKEREEICGGVCIKACRAWEGGRWWAGMIGWYRTREIWGLWAWLKRGTCTEVCWSACNLARGWLASLYERY